MAVITADKFAQASSSKVVSIRLKIDQKIAGLSLKAGDVCSRPEKEARYLIGLGRAERVKPGEEAPAKPVSATR